MKQPNFFIIGAPKCGTTSMAKWLGEHPQIFMSDPKEPAFFCTDIPVSGPLKSLEKYLHLFQSAGDQHLAVGEASVLYLLSHVAVKNILDFNPSAKLIVLLRNPIDMAPSLYGEWIWGNHVQALDDFEEQWHAWNTRECLQAQTDDLCLQLVQGCKLGEQVQRLLQTVDTKSVLFIIMDDLISDPLKEYQRVLKFLDVPYDGKTQFATHNTAKRPKYKLLQSMVMSLSIRNIKRQPRIRWLVRLLKPIYLYFNAQPNNTRQLRSEFRQELIEVFKEDIELLSSLLDRDFSHWLR